MSIHFVFDDREITGIDLIFYFLIDIRPIGLPRQVIFHRLFDDVLTCLRQIPEIFVCFVCYICIRCDTFGGFLDSSIDVALIRFASEFLHHRVFDDSLTSVRKIG